MKNRTAILKKIAAPVMGLVVAGASMLTPMSAMAKAGDPKSVSGTVAGAPCSGFSSISAKSGSATTNYYGTGGTIKAKVELKCHYHDIVHTYTASDTKSGTAGVTATAYPGSVNEITTSADGEHYVSVGNHLPWHGYTRATR